MPYLTVPQLQKLARERGIPGRSALRTRRELLSVLGLSDESTLPLEGSPVGPSPQRRPMAPRPIPPSDPGDLVDSSGFVYKAPQSQSTLPPLVYGKYTAPSERPPVPLYQSASARPAAASASSAAASSAAAAALAASASAAEPPDEDYSDDSTDEDQEAAEEISDAVTELYAQAESRYQENPLDFQTFMYWINTISYINHMETSSEYSLDDIQAFDVQERFEDEINFEARTGLELMFELLVPERRITQRELEQLIQQYRNRYPELFQVMFQQYVDPDYEVNPDMRDFEDLHII